jgi:hypothetical protein
LSGKSIAELPKVNVTYVITPDLKKKCKQRRINICLRKVWYLILKIVTKLNKQHIEKLAAISTALTRPVNVALFVVKPGSTF